MSTDTIANIKGRSLNKTGVTEKLARTYANSLGSEHLAIVRYTADSLITDADGQQKVILAIAAFEPVIDPSDDGSVEDMVRNLEAALYRNRGEADGQASIDDELDGRIALVACIGLIASVPLNAFILLFPLFGSYLVIYLAFAPWLKPFPAARYGDLSYGLYIYGWPIEQAIVWLNGGAMSWWTLFAIALPVTAIFAFLSWHLVEKRALRFKPRAAASGRNRLAPVGVDR